MKALVLRLAGAIAMTAVVASTGASSSPAAAGTAPTVERAAARADAYVAAWRGRYAGTAGQRVEPARCLRATARLVVCDVAFVLRVQPGDQLRRCRAFVLVPEPRGRVSRTSADCREVVPAGDAGDPGDAAPQDLRRGAL
jgi:hypothetical protein